MTDKISDLFDKVGHTIDHGTFLQIWGAIAGVVVAGIVGLSIGLVAIGLIAYIMYCIIGWWCIFPMIIGGVTGLIAFVARFTR